MNKNLFLGMFVAASMLFTTSCSNDELEVAQSGNEAQVTFSLGLEDGIGSRAISDGTGAKKLIYAVYKLNAEKNAELQKVVGSDENSQFIKADFKPSGDNVTITLAKGQTYQVAFWAQNPNSSAYDTKDLTKVGVNYTNASNNNESRDAFFKTVEFTVTGSTKIDVVMKRPFAQINVGVTEEDWDAAVGSGIEIEKSSVVIKNAANEINLLDGSVNGNVVVSYALQTIPTDTLMVDLDGDKKRETSYKWLSMSYILPNDETSGYEKTTLENISFVFAPKSGNNIEFSEGLNAVPVQRNWRTNILGKLLTGDIRFDIVVDPNYEDDYNVQLPYASINGVAYKTFADAMAAVKDGETIKLEGETTLEVKDAHLFTIENKSITIDLNGYGIVGNIPDITTHSSIFQVKKGGELTIEGDGNVKVSIGKTGNFISAFVYNNGGTVNLKGGNWTMTAYDNWQDALIPTFVDNSSNSHSATLNIYDGTYTFHRNIFRNHANSSKNVATMNIYGGTFNGRESEEGGIWNQNPANLQVVAGVINVKGGTFNNVKIKDEFSGVVYVENQEELENALKNVNTHTIYLGAGTFVADIYNGTPARKSLTIIGSEGTKFGHTATTGGQLRLDLFDSFTIRNCEIIQRSGYKTWGHIVFGSSKNSNGVYTIEDCTFNGVGTQGIYINENASGATYNILDCTFNGDFGKEGAIVIQTNKDVNHIVNVKGCTFNNIPATSHRIFLAKNPEVYYDFTLNTDIEASTAYEIIMLANFGYTTRVYGLTLKPDGENSKIIINDKEGFLNLTKLFTDWATLFTDGNGTTYTNYANGAGADYYYGGRWTISLEADIDLNNATISPVVIKHPVSAGAPTFEGNNHTIKNAKIVTDANTENAAGLFDASANNAMKNLKLDNIHVTGSNVGNSTAGILSGSVNKDQGVQNITITNSSVTGGKYTGGVIGYGYTDVLNCKLTDVIVKGGYKLGGLIGYICADGDKTGDVTGNTLTDCTVDGIGGGVYAGGKDKYIIGKLVGNYNCDGTCNNNTITNMTTSATANIGEIEAGKSVTQ